MIIGITGNSGTGKTSICNYLIKQINNSISLLDADKIVKQMSLPGNDYFNEIIKIFGEEILLDNGQINRAKLANIIFSDNKTRETLNKCTYKHVVEEIKKQVKLSKNEIILIDAPLLIESKLNEICDIVISVIADKETKIKRICSRDDINVEIARARLDAQKPDEFYIKNSNYIVVNNNANLEKQAIDIIELLKTDIAINKEIVIIQDREFRLLQFKKLLEFNDVLIHGFTLKPYDFGSNQTYDKNKETIEKNYKLLYELLDINNVDIVRPYQTHTSNVKKVEKQRGIFLEEFHNIDGLMSNQKNKMLSLVFADCTPIYLFDKANRVIANIHSGWQGTLNKIVQKAIDKMIVEFGSNPQNIICAIGPTIRKCHFEVEEDVKDKFYNQFKNICKPEDFILKAAIEQKYYIDTVYLNKKMMTQSGILEENIVDSNICTVCNNQLFHSYRVNKEEDGRSTAIMSLKDK